MSQSIVLSCPNCATRFSAPADKFIPNGRQVRCSNCQQTWFHAAPTTSEIPAPDAATGLSGGATVSTRGATSVTATAPAPAKATATPAPAKEATTTPEGSTIREELAQRERRRRDGGFFTWLLWALALLLLAAILAYVFRAPLARAVPSLAPALERYTDRIDTTAQRLVGTQAPASPFVLRDIRYDLRGYDEGEEGERAMLVEAQVENTGDTDLPAPQLRVRIVDPEGAPLLAAIIGPEDMDAATIKAGGSTRYFTRIPEPSADFARVLVDFEE